MRGAYDIAVEERPEPQPKPGEVVVEVIATGICGSDFHGYSGENGRRHPGQVMGHETVGRIDELGPGVSDLARGQLVTINPVMACGTCAACRDGQQQWCSRRVVLGVAPEIPAAFADRVAAPAQNVVVLPESMPAELEGRKIYVLDGRGRDVVAMEVAVSDLELRLDHARLVAHPLGELR